MERKYRNPNLDKEGHKLCTLAKVINNEKWHTNKIAVEKKKTFVKGREAANCFAESCAELTNMHITQTNKHFIKGLAGFAR